MNIRAKRIILAAVLAVAFVVGGQVAVEAGGKVGIDPGIPHGWVGPQSAAAGHNPNGGNSCYWDPDACMWS